MLNYVEVLAVTPSKATPDHVAALRQTGFRDEEIFEIVMVTAYYALRCRMADGLGVDVVSRRGRTPSWSMPLRIARRLATCRSRRARDADSSLWGIYRHVRGFYNSYASQIPRWRRGASLDMARAVGNSAPDFALE